MGKDKAKKAGEASAAGARASGLQAAVDRSEGALPRFPGFLASRPVGTPEIFHRRLDARDAQPPTVSPFPFPSRWRRIGFGGYSGAQSLSSQTYDDAAGAVEVDDDLARVWPDS